MWIPSCLLDLARIVGLWLLVVGMVSGAEPDLLLKDFMPRSMVHVPSQVVPRARFAVIDFHNHVNDARMRPLQRMPKERLLAVMDRCNIQTTIILTGLWGERLQEVVDEMVTPHPGRFIVFTQIDFDRIDEPNFGRAMAMQIEDAVCRGARGLKITKRLGLSVRDKSGRLLKVDDPRLDPIWERCGQLGIPVAIHSADPAAFFLPIDATNERYEELGRHPEWSFFGQDYPSHREFLDALERVFARFPNTTFVSLHVGNFPENLDYVSDILRRYENVHVELGARQAELGRQPRRARRFFLEFPDRILFGTDFLPSSAMYKNYFRWLETNDEYFNYWLWPAQGRWKIYGLDPPDEVLKKVYHENAEGIFTQFKGLPEKQEKQNKGRF